MYDILARRSCFHSTYVLGLQAAFRHCCFKFILRRIRERSRELAIPFRLFFYMEALTFYTFAQASSSQPPNLNQPRDYKRVPAHSDMAGQRDSKYKCYHAMLVSAKAWPRCIHQVQMSKGLSGIQTPVWECHEEAVLLTRTDGAETNGLPASIQPCHASDGEFQCRIYNPVPWGLRHDNLLSRDTNETIVDVQ